MCGFICACISAYIHIYGGQECVVLCNGRVLGALKILMMFSNPCFRNLAPHLKPKVPIWRYGLQWNQFPLQATHRRVGSPSGSCGSYSEPRYKHPKFIDMSYSLNFFSGGYIGDYIGDYYRGY